MRCTTVIVFAVMLGTGSAGAQDVCAGASSPKMMTRGRLDAPAATRVAAPTGAKEAIASGLVGVARGVSLYPGSGSGPIPDVTNWQPRGKIPIGGELVIQGRGLVPGQFYAMLGGSLLTPSAQSTSEIRFRVTDPSAAGPLLVYNKDGQARTLETAYIAYDPVAYVTRVVPTVFGVGDLVTVCGTSLFDAYFINEYSEAPLQSIGVQQSQVKLDQGRFVRIGQNWLAVVNPVVSPSGDRITFRAGGVYTTVRLCNGLASCSTLQGITDIAAAFSAYPASVTGALTIVLAGVNKFVLGPSLTWKGAAQAPPRITAVYGKAFGSRDPFVILPTSNMQTNFLAQAYVDGANLLNTTWKIGSVTVSGSASGGAQSGMPTNGSYAILSVPLNVSSGTVCASSTISTACSATPLQIFGGPVIASMPTMMPLALRTSYTIQGLNLLPPSNITGLKYRWTAGMSALDSTATNLACNMVLQVLEHTANRIVFRIGDPAKTAPVPASCASSSLFQQSPNWTMNINATLAGQPGVQLLLKQVPFYLKP